MPTSLYVCMYVCMHACSVFETSVLWIALNFVLAICERYYYSFSFAYRPALRPSLPHNQWVPGAFSQTVM
jgi:hypothetical protein